MKKLWSLAIVIIIAAVLLLAVSLMGGNKTPTYNVTQIYVTSWSMPPESDPVDVKFKVYLDLNGDRVYEVNRSSDVFSNTTFELAPFNIGGPIDTEVRQFHFIIEVLRVNGSNETPLRYANGTAMYESTGANEEGASGSWSFPMQSQSEEECTIQFTYYVN
jgi:hypothetical protein